MPGRLAKLPSRDGQRHAVGLERDAGARRYLALDPAGAERARVRPPEQPMVRDHPGEGRERGAATAIGGRPPARSSRPEPPGATPARAEPGPDPDHRDGRQEGEGRQERDHVALEPGAPRHDHDEVRHGEREEDRLASARAGQRPREPRRREQVHGPAHGLRQRVGEMKEVARGVRLVAELDRVDLAELVEHASKEGDRGQQRRTASPGRSPRPRDRRPPPCPGPRGGATPAGPDAARRGRPARRQEREAAGILHGRREPGHEPGRPGVPRTDRRASSGARRRSRARPGR